MAAEVQRRSSVTIVVVGDSGVGKTSLITTLVSGIFPETVPAVLQQVRIAPEDTADELGVVIVDTSSDEAERDVLFDRVVRNADVVICVYDLSSPETFDRLAKTWLDKISAVFKGPVLVVGNKLDLAPASANGGGESGDRMRANLKPLLDRYGVDVGLECSAKTNVHVTDLFYYAQHAVAFPIHPLLKMSDRSLTPEFKRALWRVFRFYDEDHDDFLSNSELNAFQEQCFGARLPDDDIEGIKAVLQKESTDLVQAQGITFEGFQCFFQLFLFRNRPETVWTVLRKFGYDDNLTLQSKIPVILKALTRDQGVELTKKALAFIAAVFHHFDRDNDGALSNKELDEIFSVCSGESFRPWKSGALAIADKDKDRLERSYSNTLRAFPSGCLTSAEGNVTLSGWLAQWAMTANLNPALVVDQLQRLAYPDLTLTSALKFTRKRAQEDRDTRLQRTIVRGFVFGAKGAGKSSLLNALVKKDQQQGGARSVCGTVRPMDAGASSGSLASAQNQQASWFLILTEVPEDEQLDFFSSPARLDCDLAVMLFDPNNEESVTYLEQLQTKVPFSVPCVYLANKKSREESVETVARASKLCKSYSLVDPDTVVLEPPSSDAMALKWTAQMDRLFGVLMSTALFPGAARPISDEQREIEKQRRLVRSIKRISLVLGVVGGLSWAAYHFWWAKDGNKSSSGEGAAPKPQSTLAVQVKKA